MIKRNLNFLVYFQIWIHFRVSYVWHYVFVLSLCACWESKLFCNNKLYMCGAILSRLFKLILQGVVCPGLGCNPSLSDRAQGSWSMPCNWRQYRSAACFHCHRCGRWEKLSGVAHSCSSWTPKSPVSNFNDLGFEVLSSLSS